MRLNIGSCDLPLPRSEGWINIDNSTSPHIRADLVLDGRELDSHFGPGSVEEIYAGHFLEHLYPQEAERFFAMCYGLLAPGGILAVVTPDIRHVAQKYLEGDQGFSIADLTDTYVYSYRQESVHRSLWDRDSMVEVFSRHGFKDITEIDRISDKRLAYPAPWQVGVEGRK
jgi:predicted SAM-dependent methyltransferase